MAHTEPVRVTIFNQSYSLVATGESGQIEELAQMVDDLMTSISARAGNLDGTRTAVLACLHLADQLRVLQDELDALRSRVDSKAKNFAAAAMTRSDDGGGTHPDLALDRRHPRQVALRVLLHFLSEVDRIHGDPSGVVSAGSHPRSIPLA